MSNYLASHEFYKFPLSQQYRSQSHMRNKKHAGNTFLLSISKREIKRKRSQILFTLSFPKHPTEKHTYLCNWLTELITCTWIVKQTPPNKITSIRKTMKGLRLVRLTKMFWRDKMVSKLHTSSEFLSVKKDVVVFTNIILLKKPPCT